MRLFRNEIQKSCNILGLKSKKVVIFYDNGIRNALIANFNEVELRTDIAVFFLNFNIDLIIWVLFCKTSRYE